MPVGPKFRHIRHSLALVASVGVLAAVVGGGTWTAARHIEQSLERDARTALADADIAATAHFDGRDAVIEGSVTSPEEARRASILVADLPGARQVVSHLQVTAAGDGSSGTSDAASPAAPSGTAAAPSGPTAAGAPTGAATGSPAPATPRSSTPAPAATSRTNLSAPAPLPVLFDSNASNLPAGSDNYLRAVAAYLKKSPRTRAVVNGHSDNIGPRTVNQQLSRARADAVVARLVALGVDPAQLIAQGFADTRPVASNRTADGRAANRRVEIVFEGVN